MRMSDGNIRAPSASTDFSRAGSRATESAHHAASCAACIRLYLSTPPSSFLRPALPHLMRCLASCMHGAHPHTEQLRHTQHASNRGAPSPSFLRPRRLTSCSAFQAICMASTHREQQRSRTPHRRIVPLQTAVSVALLLLPLYSTNHGCSTARRRRSRSSSRQLAAGSKQPSGRRL